MAKKLVKKVIKKVIKTVKKVKAPTVDPVAHVYGWLTVAVIWTVRTAYRYWTGWRARRAAGRASRAAPDDWHGLPHD